MTDLRLVRDSQTLIEHADVRHCEWILPFSEVIQLTSEAISKLKAAHYDRMIFELNDGRSIVLEGLGQAVFPLLTFFCGKLGRGRREIPDSVKLPHDSSV